MRDPLRNVSVRYKLALTFLVVCFLAFGVGGLLVTHSARESLEREILALQRFRSQSYAAALEGELGAYQLRARDFASDGYIRARLEEMAGSAPGEGGAVQEALRRHLLENKLPLEPAFANLALIGAENGDAFLANPDNGEWAGDLPAEATAGADWFSGLVPGRGDESAPTLVLGTPVKSLSGGRFLGTLLVHVRCRVWIAEALGGVAGDELTPGYRLRLVDRNRRVLEIPREVLDRSDPAVAARLADSGLGLRLRNPGERGAQRPAAPGVLSEVFPLELGGWQLEASLRMKEALAAVSGLQARFLIAGVVLAGAACLILLFPMRFLARPIRELRDAAMHIRGGDFSARVPVESSDEIGELSRSFNLMAEAVEERAEKLRLAAGTLERRKNELRRERDRLNAVIRSMRDGLMVLGGDGRVEVANAAAEPLRAVLENGGLELRAHRNCRRANVPVEAGALEEGNGSPANDADGEGVENPCLNCLFEPAAPPRSCLIDAGSLVYEVHSTRLSPGQDGSAGRVLVARDVTDRVAQDERQIHQERLAVLGEVAAVMAHELNNPLAAIRMFAQMIASKLPEQSPLREDVSVIERNTEACGRTIRELLDYATGATPEVGRVDVHASLREVAGFLRALRERGETELVLTLGAEEPVVNGDEVQLRQVFVNLVMNALQAGGAGRVEVQTRLDARHLVIDVMDDGPGIPDELADSVFRPFFTTKPRGSGTGLGLSTARRITEIQGGGLELADGRPGHTTFRVRLLRSAG